MILAEELARYQTNCRTILLDGHFCLLKDKLSVEDVPLETFKAISPCAIILLIDDPESITGRLSNRDNHMHNIEIVSKFQSREISRAKFISQSLEIPISIINATEDLAKLIEKVSLYL